MSWTGPLCYKGHHWSIWCNLPGASGWKAYEISLDSYCNFFVNFENFTLNFHTLTIASDKLLATQITADYDMAMNGDKTVYCLRSAGLGGCSQRRWEWGGRKEARGYGWGECVTWLLPSVLICKFLCGSKKHNQNPFNFKHNLTSCLPGCLRLCGWQQIEEKSGKVDKIDANGKRVLSKYILLLFPL